MATTIATTAAAAATTNYQRQQHRCAVREVRLLGGLGATGGNAGALAEPIGSKGHGPSIVPRVF